MSRWSTDQEEWADDDWDPEDDGPEDDDDFTMSCPYCKREIHEDAERCPYCETYLSREDRTAGPKPWWIVIGVLACLFVVYRWIFG